jgi:hypothetical protein
MSQPDYPLFSKRYNNQRYNREKRGAYNFEKTKEYDLAEKWFKERKERKQELIPVPTPTSSIPVAAPTPITPAPVAPVAALKPKGPPPGLTRPRQDSCDLDLKIPSYDDFNYVDPDEIVISPPQPTYDFSNVNLFEDQYSTPLVIEEELDSDVDSYEGQLAEFEAQEAALYNQAMYNQFMLAYQLYLQMLSMSSYAPM